MHHPASLSFAHRHLILGSVRCLLDGGRENLNLAAESYAHHPLHRTKIKNRPKIMYSPLHITHPIFFLLYRQSVGQHIKTVIIQW